MLGYLFSPAELSAVFARLGYELTDETWHRTVDYYLRRTSHGSTLSGLVHGWVLARARRADAWYYCREALEGDVALQGGTTAEGIHLGAMAGTLTLVQRGLTGMETHGRRPLARPGGAPRAVRVRLFPATIRYLGQWGIGVRLRGEQLTVSVPNSEEPRQGRPARPFARHRPGGGENTDAASRAPLGRTAVPVSSRCAL